MENLFEPAPLSEFEEHKREQLEKIANQPKKMVIHSEPVIENEELPENKQLDDDKLNELLQLVEEPEETEVQTLPRERNLSELDKAIEGKANPQWNYLDHLRVANACSNLSDKEIKEVFDRNKGADANTILKAIKGPNGNYKNAFRREELLKGLKSSNKPK